MVTTYGSLESWRDDATGSVNDWCNHCDNPSSRCSCIEETLPSNAQERKTYPIATGLLDYFPDACAEIAHVSYVGNDQHNSGQPLHWDRSKSTDEADALMRHFVQRGRRDKDGLRHSAKAAWRALALLQKEIEQERNHAQSHSLCIA